LDAFAVLYSACAYEAVARELASHFIVRHVLSIRASKLLNARTGTVKPGARLVATDGLASTGGSTVRIRVSQRLKIARTGIGGVTCRRERIVGLRHFAGRQAFGLNAQQSGHLQSS
jgi:hypothetical protein